jgi:hypothetical protein
MLCSCRTSHSLAESDEGANLDDPATAADYFSSRRLHPAGRDGTPSSSRAGTSSSSRAGTSSSSRADTASSSRADTASGSRAGTSNSNSSPRRASPDKNFRREVSRRRHLSSSCSPSRAGTGNSTSSPRRTGSGTTSSSSPRRAGAGSSSSPRRAGTGVEPGAGSSPTRAGPLLGTVGEPSRLGALYKIPKKRPQGERTATFEQCCGSSGVFIPDPIFFHPGSKFFSSLVPDLHQSI